METSSEGLTRELERKGLLIFEPLPFVRRVVFVATPHRGSYRALGVIGELASWFVNLPGRVARMSVAIATLRARGLLARTYTGIPTAITNMSPSNRFLQALESTPVVQGVTVHSIIAVQGDGKPEDGADGVVMYKSAHIDGVASEKVVRFSHPPRAIPKRSRKSNVFCWSTLMEFCLGVSSSFWSPRGGDSRPAISYGHV